MSWDNVKYLSVDGKSVVRLAVGENVVWKGLPKGYTRLDYIEATGTQYIDTGFKANQDTRIVCEILWMGGMNGFGARHAVATLNFSVRVISDRWQLGYGSDGGVTTGTIKAEQKWQTLDINKNSLYVDGVFSVSRDYNADFNTPQTVALGAIKAGAETASEPSMYYGTAKYRTCQIYNDGTLIRDFIPCKNPSGEIGMYDTVNAMFYGNAGTGEFAAGAEL